MARYNALGDRMVAARYEMGLTQEGLAERFSISKQSISQWECGLATPSVRWAREVSAALGIPIQEFVALRKQSRLDRGIAKPPGRPRRVVAE